ncbi:hypothetical protein Prede_1607 [Prevotella dentalis DSM 3688]|uniref:Uncharacterized protein n=1 Tax=Prevotella dentalis (strain ATCC 49559 / DSM 3688 / JCM 13448 / NCTC 12043 / ES 2772) TaxID=908937 RepID=L0JDI9_PREDD|nr:hypothetical protein Prede_1607 [Prevotella dentalis DSM 3688]
MIYKELRTGHSPNVRALPRAAGAVRNPAGHVNKKHRCPAAGRQHDGNGQRGNDGKMVREQGYSPWRAKRVSASCSYRVPGRP